MWLFRIQRALLRTAGRACCRVRLEGRENIPAERPLIIVCNHASFVDPYMFIGYFPVTPIGFLLNPRWYNKSAAWRFYFDGTGTVPASADDPIDTIQAVIERLRHGGTVGIFPEGRISQDGLLQRARLGFGWMAALSGALVLPCALRGTYAMLPRQRRWPKLRSPVALAVGRPLRFPGSPCYDADPAAVRDFVAETMREVCTLAGQAERIETVAPRIALDLRPKLRRLIQAAPPEAPAGETVAARAGPGGDPGATDSLR